MTEAPTRLEFITGRDVVARPGCSPAPLRITDAMQPGRAQRTHATVLCAADFDGAVDDLRRRGTPVWVEPGCEHLPHNRAWIGWRDGEYVPGFEAGTLLELIPTAALGDRIVESVAAIDVPAVPRITRRVHLVDDLDATVRLLARTSGLEPVRSLDADTALGAVTATYGFAHPRSATFELAEPRGDGPAGDYYRAWGAGPFVTGLATVDPQSAASMAESRGARVDTARTHPIVEHDALPGVVVSLEPLE
jgi:hypothetical protein